MNAQPLFKDRLDAAEMLANRLHDYKDSDPLVLAIPRGGLPIAEVLARRLGGDLDVVLVRKLGAPFGEEYAIGAIDETGWSFLTPMARQLGISPAYLAREKARQLATLQSRRAQLGMGRGPIDPQGRIVILVDDGIATGATMRAALHAVRSRQPARLVCATPVAAQDSLDDLAPLADEVACLATPTHFRGVSQFYQRFPQVSDREAIRILSRQPRAGTGKTPAIRLPSSS